MPKPIKDTKNQNHQVLQITKTFYTDVSYLKLIQMDKTHKLYKKYLYSLWVLVKPINYTNIFCIKRYKIYLCNLWVLPKLIKYTNIFCSIYGF